MTTWAQVAKSIAAGGASVEVGVAGESRPVARHTMGEAGDVLFSLQEAAPACAHLVAAGASGPDILVTVSDVSTVAHPDRVRGTVRLAGRAQVLPHPADERLREHLGLSEDGLVARLVPTSVTLDWRVEVEGHREVVHVDLEDYAAARVDALAGWQDEWIAHLDAHHGADLRRLVGSVVPVAPTGTVRPMMADESGLVVRETTPAGHRDIRVPFPTVVQCGCEAVEALKGMFAVTR